MCSPPRADRQPRSARHRQAPQARCSNSLLTSFTTVTREVGRGMARRQKNIIHVVGSDEKAVRSAKATSSSAELAAIVAWAASPARLKLRLMFGRGPNTRGKAAGRSWRGAERGKPYPACYRLGTVNGETRAAISTVPTWRALGAGSPRRLPLLSCLRQWPATRRTDSSGTYRDSFMTQRAAICDSFLALQAATEHIRTSKKP